MESRPLPPVGENQARIRAIYVSLDPAQLMWIALRSPYLRVRPGEFLPCSQIAVVEESRASGLRPGDDVTGFAYMATHSVVDALGLGHEAGAGGLLALTRIDRDPRIPLDLYLSLFSHIGVTAMSGLRLVARVRPGETMLVSGAAGATGSIVAQLAKIAGARVFGIAGGAEKCGFLVEELGLEGGIDHHGDLASQLSELLPEGVQLFWDNIGGALLDEVLLHMAPRGRIVVCGSTADYGRAPADRHRMMNIGQLLQRNVSMTPFWVSDFDFDLDENMAQLKRLFLEGALMVRPSHVVDGIVAIPSALPLLAKGQNTGKLMAKVSDLPAGWS